MECYGIGKVLSYYSCSTTEKLCHPITLFPPTPCITYTSSWWLVVIWDKWTFLCKDKMRQMVTSLWHHHACWEEILKQCEKQKTYDMKNWRIEGRGGKWFEAGIRLTRWHSLGRHLYGFSELWFHCGKLPCVKLFYKWTSFHILFAIFQT